MSYILWRSAATWSFQSNCVHLRMYIFVMQHVGDHIWSLICVWILNCLRLKGGWVECTFVRLGNWRCGASMGSSCYARYAFIWLDIRIPCRNVWAVPLFSERAALFRSFVFILLQLSSSTRPDFHHITAVACFSCRMNPCMAGFLVRFQCKGPNHECMGTVWYFWLRLRPASAAAGPVFLCWLLKDF